MLQNYGQHYGPSSPESTSFDDETPVELGPEPVSESPAPPIQGELFQILPFCPFSSSYSNIYTPLSFLSSTFQCPPLFLCLCFYLFFPFLIFSTSLFQDLFYTLFLLPFFYYPFSTSVFLLISFYLSLSIYLFLFVFPHLSFPLSCFFHQLSSSSSPLSFVYLYPCVGKIGIFEKKFCRRTSCIQHKSASTRRRGNRNSVSPTFPWFS